MSSTSTDLLLLGDQLIRDAGLAVLELVKNAYDADATSCVVIMHNIADPSKASITIEDDGMGIDRATVTGVWLEPGTDFLTLLSESHFHLLTHILLVGPPNPRACRDWSAYEMTPMRVRSSSTVVCHSLGDQ